MSAGINGADPLFGITRFDNIGNKRGTFTPVEWPRFVDYLEHPSGSLLQDDRKALPLVKLGRYEGDSRADGHALELIYGVELDHDAGTMSFDDAVLRLEAAGVECAIHTTGSHTPEAPRWRVLAPLSGPRPASERDQLLARVNGVLGGAAASESFTLKQIFFVGRCTAAPEYRLQRIEGRFLDQLPELDAGACGRPNRERPPRASVDDVELTMRAMRWPEEAALVRDALKAIPADLGYEPWARIAGALHCGSGGHDDALEAFVEWSQSSTKFDDTREDLEKKWDEVSTMTGLNLGTVFYEATQRGWHQAEARRRLEGERAREQKVESIAIGEGAPAPVATLYTLAEALEQWVLLADGTRVALRGSPRTALPLSEWAHATAASIEWVGEGKKAKPVPVAKLWLGHRGKWQTHTTTFAPGRDEFCQSPEALPALNLWVPRGASTGDAGVAGAFVEHVRYLAPVQAEADRLLDWLAHIEQRPGELPQAHYLMVARETGIGRNWLAYLLARVWAGHVALGVDLVDLLEGGFNGNIGSKVLCVVDELNEGSNTRMAGRVSNRLKSLLTEETRRVNPKYGRERIEFNCARWLMFSNHDAALPLHENDRRVVVIENPSERRDAAYYTRLYALLRDESFVEGVRAYLQARDISRFNPGEIAPLNNIKRTVINAALGDEVRALVELAREWPSDIVGGARVRMAIAEALGTTPDKVVARLDRYADAAGLRRLGRADRPDGGKVSLFCLRNHEQWGSATPSQRVAEYERGESLSNNA